MRKRKKKFWQPIVTGFAALYWMSMLLATYFMEVKYADEFKEAAALQLSSIQQRVENDLKEAQKEEPYYSYTASQWASAENSGPFQQFSVAFYQTDGTLLTKTEERIGTSWFTEDEGTVYRSYTLEHLSNEEKDRLAIYGQQSLEALSGTPPKYRISMGISRDTQELCQIVVQKITWEQSSAKQAKEYTETDSKVVWERNYPDADKTWEKNQLEVQEATLLFPCLDKGGYDQWKRWQKSEYLQNFDSQTDVSEEHTERVIEEYARDSYTIDTKDRLYTRIWADTEEEFQPVCCAELRFESHPRLAAMDYLKYVYLMGLILMIVCIAKVLYVVNNTYKQRAALEEMRRDFTNAMAHELKTPLGIIRGFAENLQEHHMENKREYYLSQIIGQTEEIDRLVTEMIAVSKMDSDQLALQKEVISMYELIREQVRRLEPLIQEKNIQVRYACDEDFIVIGDPGYLAKAMGNLLSNAVLYNIENGSIRIQTDAKKCSMENTGTPLTDEQLTHAFDMFYSGDKSRSSKDKHMGLGLFLAKKILKLHDLNISLDNTQTGVQVSIDKCRNNDRIRS